MNEKIEKEISEKTNVSEITYDEIEDDKEVGETISDNGNIKEMSIIINTLDDAIADYTTDLINGELLGCIIDSDKIINVDIYLDNFPSICLFKKVGFYGQKYLSLVNDGTYPDNEKIQNSAQRWFLNDKLKIKVDGNYNTKVKFVFRYK